MSPWSVLTRVCATLAALVLALGLGAATPAQAAPATADVSAAAAQNVRVLTYNLDFNRTNRENVRNDLGAMLDRSDVLLLQEAKTFSIQALVDELGRGGEFAVRQDLSSSAKMGSAIVIRKAVTSSIGSLNLILGVDEPFGCSLQTRYIARVQLTTTNGTVLNVASAHFPPGYCPESTYTRMMDNTVQVLQNNYGTMILGADWNKSLRTNPNNIFGRTDNRYRFRSPVACSGSSDRCIDGLVFATRFGATDAVIYNGGSDHDAIGSTFSVTPV